MSYVASDGAHSARCGVQYFPVRSRESDDFADGKITIEEYLDHARGLAQAEVSLDDELGAERQAKFERTQSSLSRVAKVVFLAVVPAAYALLGIYFLFTSSGAGIGLVSIATGALVSVVSYFVMRITTRGGEDSESL